MKEMAAKKIPVAAFEDNEVSVLPDYIKHYLYLYIIHEKLKRTGKTQ